MSQTSFYINIASNNVDEIALILESKDTNSSSNNSIKNNNNNETILTVGHLLQARNKGKTQINNSPMLLSVFPSYRSNTIAKPTTTGTTTNRKKLSLTEFLNLVLPTMTLISVIISYFLADAHGWEAVFPSKFTSYIVFKCAVLGTLIAFVGHEQSHYWYGSQHSTGDRLGLEVIVHHSLTCTIRTAATTSTSTSTTSNEKMATSSSPREIKAGAMLPTVSSPTNISSRSSSSSGNLTSKSNVTAAATTPSAAKPTLTVNTSSSSLSKATAVTSSRSSTSTTPNTSTTGKTSKDPPSTSSPAKATPTAAIAKTTTTPLSSPEAVATTPTSTKSTTSLPATTTTVAPKSAVGKEQTIPFRFIRATKGDITAARTRWADTCAWRKELGMDEILYKPHPNLAVIKENYPHYFHLRGKKNECCYYEKPPKMNLTALKKEGIMLDELLRHYALCCEYMWSNIESSEDGKSIYVIDLDGMGIRDFAGEVVEFVKRASSFTGAHYPERSGSIFVINVPSWFSMIWNVVKPMVDDVTKKKITIMRYGKEAITKALMEKIDIENIPPEYGGKSMPLGSSPEEKKFKEHFARLENI